MRSDLCKLGPRANKHMEKRLVRYVIDKTRYTFDYVILEQLYYSFYEQY